MALLCLNRNASVHVVHVFSQDVPAACREADVVISAAPVRNLIKKNMVKPGAVVVDVTTMRGDDGKQVGSLEWEGVLEGGRQRHAGARRRGARDQRHPAQERSGGLQDAEWRELTATFSSGRGRRREHRRLGRGSI